MCLQRTGGKPESRPHAWPWLTAQSLVLNLSNLLQETNSHYNFHRDYKPNQGRYIQSDPIGTDGGVNLYGYSYVNPLTYIDTTGEVPWIGVLCGQPRENGFFNYLLYFKAFDESLLQRQSQP